MSCPSRTSLSGLLLALSVLVALSGCPGSGVSTPLNIDKVTIDQTVVQPGETVAIAAEASGAESLAYLWEVEAGELAEAGSSATSWTAPENAQLDGLG
jgi:hypothetical protein